MKLVIEPSSALALAVLLSLPTESPDEPWRDLIADVVASRPRAPAGEAGADAVVRVLVVISGGNVEFGQVLKWFGEVEQ